MPQKAPTASETRALLADRKIERVAVLGANGTMGYGSAALFTQAGAGLPPVTESEVLTASEAMRGMMDYYAHATNTSGILERLASLDPAMLACQHGSAYRGDGAALLRELASTLEKRHEGLPQQAGTAT